MAIWLAPAIAELSAVEERCGFEFMDEPNNFPDKIVASDFLPATDFGINGCGEPSATGEPSILAGTDCSKIVFFPLPEKRSGFDPLLWCGKGSDTDRSLPLLLDDLEIRLPLSVRPSNPILEDTVAFELSTFPSWPMLEDTECRLPPVFSSERGVNSPECAIGLRDPDLRLEPLVLAAVFWVFSVFSGAIAGCDSFFICIFDLHKGRQNSGS